MKHSRIAPHLSTPAIAGDLRSLPTEILEQTCRRVGLASAVFAGIWTWVLVMNTVVMESVGAVRGDVDPSLVVMEYVLTIAGIAFAVLMVFVARALHHRPALLIDIGLGYAVLNALLIAVFNWLIIPPEWYPTAGVSFICIVILVYPAIAPAGPWRTLAAACLAATMDPIMYGVSIARGNVYDMTSFELLWTFAPNYLCAVLAVVPATVIRGLGKRVCRDRALGRYQGGVRIGPGGLGDV